MIKKIPNLKKVEYSTVVDTDQCVSNIENRFDLVLVASLRVRELRKGQRPHLPSNHSMSVTALLEIEKGYITRDYLKKIR
jgi:DNA-directed RNA polymerase subunit omega